MIFLAPGIGGVLTGVFLLVGLATWVPAADFIVAAIRTDHRSVRDLLARTRVDDVDGKLAW
jgi:hypothetical protein